MSRIATNVNIPAVTDNLPALFSGRWQGNAGGAWAGRKPTPGEAFGMFIAKDGEWMSGYDATRLNLYRQNSLMFLGLYYDAFKAVRTALAATPRADFYDEQTWEVLYVMVNVLGLASKKHADMIAAEPPEIRPTSRKNDGMIEAIRRISKNSKLDSLVYQIALSSGYKGDAVLKVEFDPAARDSENPNGKVRIGRVKPECWFPRFNRDDMDEIESHAIVSVMTLPKSSGIEKQLLKRIIHFPDRIERRLNIIDGNRILDEIVPETVGLPSWEPVSPHDIGAPLVCRVPNFLSEELPFGMSDYSPDVKALADELNHRLTQYSKVLDQHGNPKLSGPDIIGPDGRIHIEDYFAYESDQPKPEYLTLPSDALQHMASVAEDFVPLLLFQLEMSPALVGWKESAAAEKVEALRLRSFNTLMHAKRRRAGITEALRHVFRVAMEIENRFGGFKYEIEDVEISWTDGFPASELEQAQTMALRLGGKASISQEGAVVYLEGEGAAEVEIERMKAEGAISEPGGNDDALVKPLSKIFEEKMNEKTEPVPGDEGEPPQRMGGNPENRGGNEGGRGE